MPALPAETDVLVVGAGPVGLALAASLTELGVGHVLIDRNNGIQPGTKAAAIQPATLEYLGRLGVAAGLVAVGLKGQGFRLRDGQRTLLRIPYDELDTPFPFLLLISQQVTEEHLAHDLAEKGGTIHRGHRLISFTPDFPGVTATIATPDDTVRAVQARYVVGCDGVHSRVRTAAGISFPGHAREQLYALAEFRLSGGNSDAEDAEDNDTINYISPDGMLLTTPLPGGQFRMVASVPAGSAPPTAADAQALLDTRGPGAGTQRVAEIIDASTYHAQERVADRMSDGPVFLAGDAAHTHSPAGGQGMNTGIQDAANLAWKLHAVLTGVAPEALLDTYNRERHPVAASRVAFTSQIADLVTAADPASASLRNDIIAAVATAPSLTSWLGRRLSQLDISYPVPAAAPADGPYQPGHRVSPAQFAPAGLTWTLAVPKVATGPADDGPRGNLTVRVDDGLDTTLLIRPDGYLAACGVAADPAAVLARLGHYAQGT